MKWKQSAFYSSGEEWSTQNYDWQANKLGENDRHAFIIKNGYILFIVLNPSHQQACAIGWVDFLI